MKTFTQDTMLTDFGFFYNGDANENILKEIKNIIAFDIKTISEIEEIEKQALNLFSKSLYNIINYKQIKKESISFIFLKTHDKYTISIINRMDNSEIEHIKARIKSILKRKSHGLSKEKADKLDKKYNFTLELINTAKNYKRKVFFTKTVFDENLSDLHFKIDFSLNDEKKSDVKIYDNFYKVFETSINKNNLLNYQGTINDELISTTINLFNNTHFKESELYSKIQNSITNFNTNNKKQIEGVNLKGTLFFNRDIKNYKIKIGTTFNQKKSLIFNDSYSDLLDNIQQEELFIEATDDTPTVDFSKTKNLFKIKGTTVPEDPGEFYKPILKWFKQYIKKPNKETVLEFELIYANTASSKQIIQLMLLLEKIEKNKIGIKWYYEEFDTDILELGLRYSKLLNINFQIIDIDYTGQENLIIKTPLLYTYLSKKRNIFRISGSILKLQTDEIYTKIYNWLQEYKNDFDPNPVSIFNVCLNDFKNDSYKIILNILQQLKELATKTKITINWQYENNQIFKYGKKLEKELNIDFIFSEQKIFSLDKIEIKETDYTPKIILDKEKNIFLFEGTSELKTSYEFYKPVVSWFNKYAFNSNENTIIKFNMEYLDLASRKQIIYVMLAINDILKNTTIEWAYYDIVMLEYGKRYSKLIRTDFKFIKNY